MHICSSVALFYSIWWALLHFVLSHSHPWVRMRENGCVLVLQLKHTLFDSFAFPTKKTKKKKKKKFVRKSMGFQNDIWFFVSFTKLSKPLCNKIRLVECGHFVINYQEISFNSYAVRRPFSTIKCPLWNGFVVSTTAVKAHKQPVHTDLFWCILLPFLSQYLRLNGKLRMVHSHII